MNGHAAKGDGELLIGAKAIGRFLGMTQRQVFYRAEGDTLPVLRMGRTLCARPTSLRAWVKEQEQRAADE